MAKKKKEGIRRIVVPRNATEREIYDAIRRDFSAADLQRFTELGPYVTAERLLRDMETIHRAETKKRRKK